MQFGPSETSDKQPAVETPQLDGSSSAGSPESQLLSDMDFRRLGVSLNETRRTVIRRAADRSARTLAKRQLVHPNEKTAVQLSQVATSAYRLLDPRQRDSSKDRVYVGRIMPNAIQWAGRTSFAVGTGESTNADPSCEYVDDREYEEVISVESLLDAPATGMDLNAAWSRSLDSSDLLRPGVRRVRWFRQQLHRPSVLLGLTALLFITTAWSWARISKNRKLVAMRRVHPAVDVLDSSDNATLSGGQADSLPAETSQSEASGTKAPALEVGPSVELPSRSVQSLPFETEPAPSIPVDVSRPVESNNSVESNSSVETPELAKPVASNLAMLDPKVDFVGDVWGRFDVVETDEHMMAVLIEDVQPIQPEFQIVDAVAEVVENDSMASPPSTTVKEDLKSPVPTVDEIRLARGRLLEVIPSLSEPIAFGETAGLIRELDEASKVCDPGSIDDWVVSACQTQVTWLSSGIADVRKNVMQIEKRFDSTSSSMLAFSFSEAAKMTLLDPVDPKLQRHLIAQGVRLIDDLIVDESWDAARTAMRALRDLAEPLNAATEFDEQIGNLADGLAKAERFAAIVSTVKDSDPKNVERSKAASAGRFYCFLLRRWDQGLPWLAAGNDPRLAAIASDELMLSGESDQAATIELAERWLTVAKRDSDRAANSMKLHAIDLLQKSSSQQRGIMQLKTKRLLDEVLQGLPPHLAYLTEPGPERSGSPAESVPNVSAVEPKVVGATPSGMNGRIRVDGADVGLGMEYQPGVAITKESFRQIREFLNGDDASLRLELTGTIDLAADSIVRVQFGSESENVSGAVWVADRRLELVGANSAFLTPLPAGQHDVRWQIEGDGIDSAFFVIGDVISGKKIVLRPSYEPQSDDLPTVSTVKLLPSSP